MSSSVWWGFVFRLRDGVRVSGGARQRTRERGGGEGHTGHGAGCFYKAVSPGMHTPHAGVVRVVCPRDGLAVMGGLAWGDDGGAVGRAVLLRVRGGGTGGSGRGTGGGGGYGTWWWWWTLDELDDLNRVGLADVEMARVLFEGIAVE